MNEEMLTSFIQSEFDSNKDVIEDLSFGQIEHLIETEKFVVVFAYSTQNCETCDETLVQLESIDDDAEAVGIRMVRTDDRAFLDRYGVESLPQVVYFEDQNPSFYESDPREESELLTWLLYQMREDTIENINRDLMVKMIEDNEFLAVFFCKFFVLADCFLSVSSNCEALFPSKIEPNFCQPPLNRQENIRE